MFVCVGGRGERGDGRGGLGRVSVCWEIGDGWFGVTGLTKNIFFLIKMNLHNLSQNSYCDYGCTEYQDHWLFLLFYWLFLLFKYHYLGQAWFCCFNKELYSSLKLQILQPWCVCFFRSSGLSWFHSAFENSDKIFAEGWIVQRVYLKYRLWQDGNWELLEHVARVIVFD